MHILYGINVKKYYQKQKHLQQISYIRRKQFKDPYWKVPKELKNLFKADSSALLTSPKDQIGELLKEDYYNHIKILDYVGLKNIRPPYWFRNLALHYLLNLFENWKAQANLLNQEYYLKLWIYDDEFSRSEIVFGLNNKIKRYNNLFERHDQKKNINFLTKDMQSKISNYNIQYCKEMNPLSVDDLNEISTSRATSYAIKMGYEIDKHLLFQDDSVLKNLCPFMECGFIQKVEDEDFDEVFYIMHIDNIWVLD